MDNFTAIRISAFRAVTAPDQAYLIRKILRWYSKTFHTPLTAVEELPLEDVVRTYHEELFEEMSPEDREAERLLLLQTPEERLQKILAEEAEEAEMFQMRQILAQEEAAKKKAPAPVKPGEIAPIAPRPPIKAMDKEQELPAPKKEKELPPGIEMKFMPDDDLEAEIARVDALADGRPQSSG